MKSFPASFNTEKNKAVGSKPIWIIRLTINSIDYYLSSKNYTIGTWNSTAGDWSGSTSITTLPIVKNFGLVEQGVTNWISEFQVSETSVELILNKTYIDLEALVTTYNIEQNPVNMYMWFQDNATVPQLMFSGFVNTISNLTDTSLTLNIQDSTVKLENAYLGTKVDNATYPQAASADVGKIIPLAFGPVTNAPTVLVSGGVITSLKANCTAAATSLSISDTSGFVTNQVYLIEDEQVLITGVGTDSVTVTRAYNSTTASAHTSGTAVVQLANQVYLVSTNTLSALSKVNAKVNDILVDITSLVSVYTGASGSQLAGYGSYGAIQILAANFATLIRTLSATAATADPNHGHVSTNTKTQVASDIGVQYGGDTWTIVTVTPSFVATANITEQTCTYAFGYGGNTESKDVYVNGTLYQTGYSSNARIEWTGTTVATPQIEVRGTGTGTWVRILSGTQRVVTYNANTTNSATGITVDLNGSNLTTYLGSGKIFWDGIGTNGTLQTFCNYVTNSASLPNVTLRSGLPSYTFGTVINEYKTCLAWLNKIAFENKAWFAILAGVPTLVSRADTSVKKIITACKIDENGVKTLSRKTSESNDLINKINCLSKRNWSLGSDDTSYENNTILSDATSKTLYGEHEQADRFKLNFVSTIADSSNLSDFYLSLYKNKYWIATFDVFLDHCELEFGDYVQLDFLNRAKGFVLNASLNPGSHDSISTVTLKIIIFK